MANLPQQRRGIIDLGVTIRVEPKLPYRPQAQVRTERLGTKDTPTVDLHFFPGEEPEYSFFTYVVLRDNQGLRQFKSETKVHRGDRLYLSPADFPVDFLPVAAEHSLLDVAEVEITWKRPEGDSEIQESLTLTLEQPTVTLALPKETERATLTIQAHSREGFGTLQLAPLPAQPLQVGLYSFPEAGAQKVKVECRFEQKTQPVLWEFLPEGEPENSTAKKVLYFTPRKPQDDFTWLPRSPFQSRYRHRRQPLVTSPTSLPEWSDYCSPFASLTIHA